MSDGLLVRAGRRGTRAGTRLAGRQGEDGPAGSYWRYRLASLVAVALLWEVFAIAADSLLVPTFTETAAAMVTLLGDPATWQAILATNVALAVGFAASVLVGIPLGFWIGRSPTAAGVVNPYITIMLVAPMAALIPLIIMAVGIGLAARVTLIALFAVPMIVVNAKAGVRGADPGLLEMGRSFGATERQLWRRVLLPGSLPAVMSGIRIGLGRAITAMIIVELLVVAVGLGGLLLRYRAAFRADLLYATTLIVVIEALILIGVARALERRATAWAGRREPLGR